MFAFILGIGKLTYGLMVQGAPIAGYILNASGGQEGGINAYRPAIFYAGSMATAATILSGVVRIKVDRRIKKTV